LQMNKDHDYGGCVDNQLRVFEHLGLLNKFNYGRHANEIIREELEAKGLTEERIKQIIDTMSATRLQREPKDTSLLAFSPDRYRKLVDPYDRKGDLDKRARSYLHANCAQCHVDAGGGNALFNVEFTSKPEATKLFDVRPVHSTFGLTEARLVAPGYPERSVLLLRMSHRNQGHMPPLATAMVDSQAVEMLREWIKQMPAARKDD
jgi:mono/diheme cytochrome c family protein